MCALRHTARNRHEYICPIASVSERVATDSSNRHDTCHDQRIHMRGLIVVALLVALFGAACAQLIVKKETLDSRNGVYGIRVSYKKQGASSVTDVKIKDSLPETLELVSGKLSISGPAVRCFFSFCLMFQAMREHSWRCAVGAGAAMVDTRKCRQLCRRGTESWACAALTSWASHQRTLCRACRCCAVAVALATMAWLTRVSVAAHEGLPTQRLLRAPCRSGVLAGQPHIRDYVSGRYGHIPARGRQRGHVPHSQVRGAQVR